MASLTQFLVTCLYRLDKLLDWLYYYHNILLLLRDIISFAGRSAQQQYRKPGQEFCFTIITEFVVASNLNGT